MESSKTFYQKLKTFLSETPVAVATIIDVRGSVPREVGTKMIIHPLGQHYATVGGGCGEGEVIRAGLNVIDTGQSEIVTVDLTEEVSLESSGVCGGILDVYIERWSKTSEASASQSDLLNNLINAIEANLSAGLVTAIKKNGCISADVDQRILVFPDKPPVNSLISDSELEAEILADTRQAVANHQSCLLTCTTENETVEFFVEVLRRPPTLIIVGAGHIAQPLAQLSKMIDFEVVVLDDRPKFANPQRFPTADKVLAQPLQDTLKNWPIDKDTYVVLVTRGHTHDVDCLLEIIDSPARYIGMIGSKRRIKSVFKLLEEEQGIDPIKFNRIYAPVGLDIGAENPAEIAVSVMGEIINVYRRGRAQSLSDALRTDRGLPLHPGRIENKLE